MKLSEVLSAPHMQAPKRFAVVTLSVCALDVLVILFVQKPHLWAALIPGLIPVLTVPFVIMPMKRAAKKS